MSGPLRPQAAAVAAVVVLAATVTPWALGAIAVALWAAWDDGYARASGWVVYRLLDADGRTLYVGSTGDLNRRAREHVAEPDPWRRSITHVVVHRHCHSEHQARRVERRLIGAITVASRSYLCAPLHNELLIDPGPVAHVWHAVARLQGACWSRCAWRGGRDALRAGTPVPRRTPRPAAAFLGDVPTRASQRVPTPLPAPIGAVADRDSVQPFAVLAARRCRECGSPDAPRPGPRCVEHHRAYERTRKRLQRTTS